MKKFKTIILWMFILLSTGLNANTVNIAPIITYLLSDTTSSTSINASNFTMMLDVNEAMVIGDWKVLSSVSNTETTATVKAQGTFGIFSITDDTLTYLKTTETNATDNGILVITDGTETVEITITLKSLYWKRVSGGYGYTAAIKSDGTLWAWGSNSFGQLGDSTTNEKLVPTQEFTKSTNWTSVSTGYGHTVAIKSDGTLWAWGWNYYGELGNGTTSDKHIPTQEFTKSTNWTSVSTNFTHTVAIKNDGTLWAWGQNSQGQLGDGTEEHRNVPTQESTGAYNWGSVNAGNTHTAAIKLDGTLWSWGSNWNGELGNGTTEDNLTPVQEDTNATDWISVSASGQRTTAIKIDGTLWGWGDNRYGEIGDNTTIDKLSPTQEFTSSNDWSTVSTSSTHTVAIKTDGTLWAWGNNTDGQLGDGTTIEKHVPTQESTDANNWSTVSAGSDHTAAIKTDGTLWAWGNNTDGQLGDGTKNDKRDPIQPQPRHPIVLTASNFTLPLYINESTATGNWKILSLVNDTEATASIKTQGIYGIFSIVDDTLLYMQTIETNATDQVELEIINEIDTIEITVTVELQLWKQVSNGYQYTVAIKPDGTLWGWGYNQFGQLGDGTTIERHLPSQESTGATDWSFVSAGYNHTVAIKTDGTLWAWGANSVGQLGDGTTIERHVPTQEDKNDTDWISMSTGTYHTVAIKTDSTLWAWGSNYDGQLAVGGVGDGYLTVPEQEFTGASDWNTVSAGSAHTAAIKLDGTLWAWGSNWNGQIGAGGMNEYYSPSQESTMSNNWSSVSAGGRHTTAVKSDGTLWAWGDNTFGSSTYVPTQEPSEATNWNNVSSGSVHTVAIKSDGTLWAWGDNDYGQLGDGTTTERHVPTQEFTGATDWSFVSAGGRHTSGIKSDDTLWLWGLNYYGELGNGTTIDKHKP